MGTTRRDGTTIQRGGAAAHHSQGTGGLRPAASPRRPGSGVAAGTRIRLPQTGRSANTTVMRVARPTRPSAPQRIELPSVAPRVPSPASAAPARAGTTTRSTTSRRLPGLDGVRALAVLAVMAYHFEVPHTGGGFLGVDIFFVLSGYLITSGIWSRWGDTGVALGAFWAARVRRLAPALLALLLVTTIAVAIAHPTGLETHLHDVVASLTYTSNWWYVVETRPYGDFQAWNMLQHLWSLAIEEQFYVVWPLLVAAVMLVVRSRAVRRRVLLTLAVGGALASSLLMSHGAFATTGPWASNPTRVYFGTDTHVMGLLIGAALALWLDGAGFTPGRSMPRARLAVSVVGCVFLAAVLAAVSTVDFFDMDVYRYGGFLLFSLVTAALVWAVAHDGPLTTLLGCRPLRYVADRSYALYLWHWPLVTLPWFAAQIRTDWRIAALELTATTFVLAELSHRLVEKPVRSVGIIASLRTPRVPATLLAMGLVAAASIVGVRLVDPVSPTSVSAAIPGLTPAQSQTGASASPSGGSPASPSAPSSTPTSTSTPNTGTVPDGSTKHLRISVWGDSVPDAVAMAKLPASYASVSNHAVVAAQATTVLPRLEAAARSGGIPEDVVLLHTGDNGTVPSQMLAEALDSVKDKRVVLVLPKTIRPEGAQARDAIREAARGRSWVHLVDWYDASKDHPEYFVDGTHLTFAAMPRYVAMVQRASVE